MEVSRALNQHSRDPNIAFEDGNSQVWNSQYFWDFLTKSERPVESEPKTSYNYGGNDVEDAHRVNDFRTNTEFVNDIQTNTQLINSFEVNRRDAMNDFEVHDFDTNTQFINSFEVNCKDDVNDFEVHPVNHEDDTNTNYVTSFEVDRDTKVNQDTEVHYPPDYEQFIKATNRGDWNAMEEFVESHPDTLGIALFPKERTALHYALNCGKEEVAKRLIDKMKASDLSRGDQDGLTPLAVGALHNYKGILELLELMVSKNPDLPNIGSLHRVPVLVASWKGFKDTTRYLYGVTHENILNPKYGSFGVQLLTQCINIKLFDIALDIVKKFSGTLHERDEDGIYPIQALAKTLSASPSGIGRKKSNFAGCIMDCLFPSPDGAKVSEDKEERVHDQAIEFLRLVCTEVEKFDAKELEGSVHEAMIEASKHGDITFISKMVNANPDLIRAKDKDGKSMFWHAVENRQAKVFNLIYDESIEAKDSLLSLSDSSGNNILHVVAMLPKTSVPDRDGGPALQMQRELQWFKEVRNVVKARYRGDLNKDKLTPRALFTQRHERLVDAGEKAMKDTAQSATTVCALIVTIMFAVAFTFPGGNDQTTGYPLFVNDARFQFLIVCDVVSLFSSAASLLIFLGILTSRHSEEDFLYALPRRIMMGFFTLFISIATMILTFCVALIIMLRGRIWLISPIIVPFFLLVVYYLLSVCPVLVSTYRSTYGSIFNKNFKLLGKGKRYNPSSFAFELPNEKADVKVNYYTQSVGNMKSKYYAYSVDKIV